MIRHIVMWKFNDETSRDSIVEMQKRLEDLREKVPSLVEISVGPDISHKERSWDMALNSCFNSVDDLRAYATHPAHLKVVEFIKPLVKETAAVDYEE